MPEITVYDYTTFYNALTSPVYDIIYLGSDILMPSGANIEINRAVNKIIDGTDPNNPQERHYIRDVNISNLNNTMRVPAGSQPYSITFRNLDFQGRNDYGICYVDALAANASVELHLENLNYSGPQPIHNRYGSTHVRNCSFEIGQYNDTVCNTGEFCETNRLFLYGRVNVVQETTILSCLWFSYYNTAFTVMPDADVSITTASYTFYMDLSATNMTFSENSKTVFTAAHGMFTYGLLTQLAGSILVNNNATLIVRQSGRNGYETFKLSNSLTVNESGVLEVYVSDTASSTAMFYCPSTLTVNFNNPRRVALYNNNARLFSVIALNLGIRAEMLNIWQIPLPLSSAGKFDDIPANAWAKTNGSDITANVTCNSTAATGITSNLTSSDTGGALTTGNFNPISARVLSLGRLDITAEDITDFSLSVDGNSEPSAKVRLTLGSGEHIADVDTDGIFTIPLPEYPIKGEEAVLLANTPFLLKQIKKTVLGSLRLSYIPDYLPFRAFVAPHGVEYIKRIDTDWRLEVADTRVLGADWRIYAYVSGEMLSENASLGYALGVKSGTAFTPLSETETPIYYGEAEEDKITTVTWAELEGPLLRIMTEYPYEKGLYSTEVFFVLSTD